MSLYIRGTFVGLKQLISFKTDMSNVSDALLHSGTNFSKKILTADIVQRDNKKEWIVECREDQELCTELY